MFRKQAAEKASYASLRSPDSLQFVLKSLRGVVGQLIEFARLASESSEQPATPDHLWFVVKLATPCCPRSEPRSERA